MRETSEAFNAQEFSTAAKLKHILWLLHSPREKLALLRG